MKWFVLWTDALLFLLILMLMGFVWRVITYPPLRHQIKDMLKRPVNCAALMVLLSYLLVGILDSIHFEIVENGKEAEYHENVISLLDIAVKPLIVHQERSYSAPFATHGYTKENKIQADGLVVREFPRLKFGGAHLEDPTLKGKDIRNRTLATFLQSIILWLAIAVLICFRASKKAGLPFEEYMAQVLQAKRHFPMKTILGMLFLLVFLLMFLANFMSYYHILGTSKVGEDVLYLSIKSIRTGLVIGTLTTLIMLPFATILGIMAGYFRGIIDDIIQYTYTTLSSIPGVLLIAAAVLTLQVVMNQNQDWFQTMAERSDARLLALCAILGLTSWTGLCRLLRGEALKLRDIEYVQAARSLGTKHFKILFKHILPNVMHIILIAVALDFSSLVLAEAVLSYVGVGVDPTTFSWGTMINSARLEMARSPIVWWSLLSAFVFMFVLVLAANIFSDALRDAFDPKTQKIGG